VKINISPVLLAGKHGSDGDLENCFCESWHRMLQVLFSSLFSQTAALRYLGKAFVVQLPHYLLLYV